MSLRHPIALLAFIALTACGPEFEGTELAPTDTLDSVESGMTTQACTTTQNLLLNPGFESGNVRWTAPAGAIATGGARTGSWRAMLGGKANGATTHLKQTVTIPSTACTITFRFFLKVTTTEPPNGWIVDTLQANILDSYGVAYERLGWYDNSNAGTGYVQKSFTLDPALYRGLALTVDFEAYEDYMNKTNFFVDDVALLITR
jgi:hypothetical protein